MEKIEVKEISNAENETSVVIFLGEEDYNVKDRQTGELKPVKKFFYYDLTTGTPGEISIRYENLSDRGADKITYADEDWRFPVYAIMREWERNRNYQNLRLKGIRATGKFMKLLDSPVL